MKEDGLNKQSGDSNRPSLFPIYQPPSSSNVPFRGEQELLRPDGNNLVESYPRKRKTASKVNQQQENLSQNLIAETVSENPKPKKNKLKVARVTKVPQGKKGQKKTSPQRLKVVKSQSVRDVSLLKGGSKKSGEQLGLLKMLVFYPLRLLILGVGMGAIAGTVLANYDSTKVGVAETKPTAKIASDLTYNSPSPLSLGKEIIPLKEKLVQLAAKYPNLTPGIFFVDLDNSAYVSIAGDASFASASTIKIPILVAFFQDVDAGKIRLDQMLTMTEEVMADGSGNMQYEKPGTQFTARETAEKMIVISDNTATNMLIELLGGAEVLNERFGKWGLQNTRINNSLPDLEGTNTTSPWDLAYVLTMVTRGELVSLRSRDRLLNIMRETQTDTLLPQGLETGAVIAHKTGDIGAVLGDAGIVDMVNGKRYIAAVLVKRPHNDYAAKELIQEISRTAYQHFKFYDPRPLTQAGGGS